MSKLIQKFPNRDSFKPELDGAESAIKEVKEENARRLEAAEAVEKEVEKRVRELHDIAACFLSGATFDVWPIERRELEDGRTELVAKLVGHFCDRCLHRFGVTDLELQKQGIDQVRVLYPRSPEAWQEREVRVCTHYHESRGEILYPSRFHRGVGCCSRCMFGNEFQGCLPEFPGRLVWEFYDPDPDPTPSP